MQIILALYVSKKKTAGQITTGICKQELMKMYQMITFFFSWTLVYFFLGYIYILTTL